MATKIDATYIIKKPLLTEKSTIASNELNRYTFQVDLKATKGEIKSAVESLYKVQVEKINTQVRKGRDRRYRYGLLRATPTKVAHVRLKEGQKIELV
ncbi:MAG: 50S ribosomal protein L23 [Phycisphaerales bacterium]|jgi:large subunit ribosomal protein L23|nr:50S ribosomal protein L23 [Phycisphaeraceae bacterium]